MWYFIEKFRNYFVEEIEQNELISEKYKRVCTTMHYIEYILILAFAFTEFLFLLIC